MQWINKESHIQCIASLHSNPACSPECGVLQHWRHILAASRYSKLEATDFAFCSCGSAFGHEQDLHTATHNWLSLTCSSNACPWNLCRGNSIKHLPQVYFVCCHCTMRCICRNAGPIVWQLVQTAFLIRSLFRLHIASLSLLNSSSRSCSSQSTHQIRGLMASHFKQTKPKIRGPVLLQCSSFCWSYARTGKTLLHFLQGMPFLRRLAIATRDIKIRNKTSVLNLRLVCCDPVRHTAMSAFFICLLLPILRMAAMAYWKLPLAPHAAQIAVPFN